MTATATPPTELPRAEEPKTWPADESGKRMVEHLKLIQAVITRQNHSGFVVKGWSVTTTGAVLAFAMLHPELSNLAFIGAISSGVCWWLDAHYLHYERQFRCLYTAVHELKPVPEFSMDPGPWVSAEFTSIGRSAKRGAVMLIHLPMMLFAIVAGLLLHFK